MFKAQFTFDSDIVDAINKSADDAIFRFERNLVGVIEGEAGQRVLIRLKTEPDPPDYPIRWTSPDQRKAVMKKLRMAGMKFYIRTHDLSSRWTLEIGNITGNSGVIEAVNPTSYTDFVQGESQQRYLSKWPLARQVIRDNEDSMESEVVNAWLEATVIE